MEIIVGTQLSNVAAQTTLDIQGLVTSMQASGMSRSAIKDILMADLTGGGRLFGNYRNQVKNTVKTGIGMAGNNASRSTFTKAGIEKFQWVSVGDGKVCPDCEPRHGEVEDLKYWELIGLPQSGFSVCQQNCRCQLVPESYKGENLDKPLVRGKKKSKWKPSMSLKKAENYVSKSKVKTTLFHGTTETRKKSIINRGFVLEEKKNGRMWGDGVYLSYQSEQASEWARLTMLRDWTKVKSKSTTLNIKANVKNPLIINSGEGFPKHWTEQFMNARAKGYSGERGVYYTNIAKKEGYDSIIVKMPRKINESYDDWLVRTGGDQLVVFNAKNIVAIS